ncbi:MAG: hypothetical protein ACTS73_08565 [Arsenophonus sp. NEOnobi-MAG3]
MILQGYWIIQPLITPLYDLLVEFYKNKGIPKIVSSLKREDFYLRCSTSLVAL